MSVYRIHTDSPMPSPRPARSYSAGRASTPVARAARIGDGGAVTPATPSPGALALPGPVRGSGARPRAGSLPRVSRETSTAGPAAAGTVATAPAATAPALPAQQLDAGPPVDHRPKRNPDRQQTRGQREHR